MSAYRDLRRSRHENLRCRQTKATRAHRIICVGLSELAMPEWAHKKRVRGLSMTVSTVWLERKDALFLAARDREVGGDPILSEAEFRRCSVCDRPLLGQDAMARRRTEESSSTGQQIPCGPTCIEASTDRRWR